MTPGASPADPLPPTNEERERVLAVLRENATAGRLTNDTFARRIDLALAAQSHAELQSLTEDLPGNDRWSWMAIRVTNALGVRSKVSHPRERKIQPLPLPGDGQHVVTIGRDSSCDLTLPDQTVSRKHAELRRGPDGWEIYEFGSTNGTFVNGQRVHGNAPVHPGDQVRFGRLVFRVEA